MTITCPVMLNEVNKLPAACRTSDLCECAAVSSKHARVKPRWSDVINMAGVFGSHKGHCAGVLFHRGLRAWMRSPRLLSGLYEGRGRSLFPPCLIFFLQRGTAAGTVIMEAAGWEFRWPPPGLLARPCDRGSALNRCWVGYIVKQAATSVFIQNNQGPATQHGQLEPVIKGFVGPAEGRLRLSDLSTLCWMDQDQCEVRISNQRTPMQKNW